MDSWMRTCITTIYAKNKNMNNDFLFSKKTLFTTAKRYTIKNKDSKQTKMDNLFLLVGELLH
jgi:hypothetical protein